MTIPKKAWRIGRRTNQAYHVTGPRVPQPAYLPARFGLIDASVANQKTNALPNGCTKIEYNGSGTSAPEDRDHADRKDQFILIYGTLLATALPCWPSSSASLLNLSPRRTDRDTNRLTTARCRLYVMVSGFCSRCDVSEHQNWKQSLSTKKDHRFW
jgi:hypothetical protein